MENGSDRAHLQVMMDDARALRLACCVLIAFGHPLSLSAIESFTVFTTAFRNNSYSCSARFTKDGLEYCLTYDVCVPVPVAISDGDTMLLPDRQTFEIQCMHYQCTITSAKLMTDGLLTCSKRELSPHQALNRHKRDFDWMKLLESVSVMGKHASSVSKQNEAYFHYNYAPTSGGSHHEDKKPVLPPPPPPSPAAPVESRGAKKKS